MVFSRSSLRRWCATNFHGRLLWHPPTAAEAGRAMRHSLSAAELYGLATVMAFVWPPGPILAQIVVPLVFFPCYRAALMFPTRQTRNGARAACSASRI
jgi:hypothetical protein